ncbi:protein of unknown function [Sterolibacterium denitrificans]|uniref:Uncharacterized protein n=1 Tax=Sterolibacterium denitrificans TaxID=157592 RepID=A0A7Z7HRA5_9PROT|nr:protein of unknown function [Sterolibacterium denitrificans]
MARQVAVRTNAVIVVVENGQLIRGQLIRITGRGSCATEKTFAPRMMPGWEGCLQRYPIVSIVPSPP